MFPEEKVMRGDFQFPGARMFKAIFVNLLAVTLFGVCVYGQDKSRKAEWLDGVVVAYDAIKATVPCYDYCDQSLIVRLSSANEDKPQYVRVDVRMKESQKFPRELVASKRAWRFKVRRTAELDEPVYDYIVQNATSYSAEKKYPVWKLIPGAENETLPFGAKIASYSMNKNGFKAIAN